MSNQPELSWRSYTVPGLAVFGLLTTGAVGVILALRTDEATGLLAAALAFGIVLYVSFR